MNYNLIKPLIEVPFYDLFLVFFIYEKSSLVSITLFNQSFDIKSDYTRCI